MREVSTIIGGIGGLILAYLVLKYAQQFGMITNSIATSSSSLIGTLQGNGSGFGAGVGSSSTPVGIN